MSRHRDAGLFFVLSLFWGTAFVAIRAGLESIPPVLFASFRYDLAAVLMLAYAAYATENWYPRTRADWLTVGVSAVLIIAVYNALLFIGQQGVTSAVAAILIASSPILTTGFSRLFFPDEGLALPGMVGLTLGFVGVFLVASPEPSTLLTSELVAPGLVFLAAVAVALGSVLLQGISRGISTEGMTAWSFAFGAIMLHLLSVGLPTESFSSAELTTTGVISVVYLSVFASAVGYFVYFRLLDRLGAIEINLVSYAAPVFAAIFGWLLLGETIDLLTVGGFFLIFAGFLLIKRDAIAAEFAR